MLTANTVIDFFVPGKFSEEIKRGNCAVAWLSAGSFIGIGEILRAVIMSPAVTTADTSLLHGIVASVVYAVLGIVLFVTGYMFINIWHRKYKLSEEIKLDFCHYIKLGPYISSKGPLNNPNTNQRLYQVVKRENDINLFDITSYFTNNQYNN